MPSTRDGASPLHVASINGHVDATRALLKLGAAPQVRGARSLAGKTPWDLAPDPVRQAYINDLFSQVAKGDADKVDALLRAGVQADSSDGGPRRDTPLHWAASFGHIELCSLLLEEGARINRCNNEGASPLHEASRGGHAGVVRLLLQRGANPHIVGTEGVFNGKIPEEVSPSEVVSALFSASIAPPSPHSPTSNESLTDNGGFTGSARDLAGARALGALHSIPTREPQTSFQTADGKHKGGGETRSGQTPVILDNGKTRGGDAGGGASGVKGSDTSGDFRVDEGETYAEGEETKRENIQQRLTQLSGDAYHRHSAANERNPEPATSGAGAESVPTMPMLWPPPRSCTVLRSEVCRIPSQVVVVLPAGGIAGPGTLTVRTLLAALATHGVTARCTRGRCPPGLGKEFFVTLSSGGLKGSSARGTWGGQGFSLVAGKSMVRVAGAGEIGLYYGVCTLCQILSMYAWTPPKKAVLTAADAAVNIPCCIIKDEPDVDRRCLVLDIRYPFLPTLPSLMRTIEATSRSRMNVIQLAVTRETAFWLAGNDGQGEGDTDGREGAKHEGDVSGGARGRDTRKAKDGEEEGRWGWSTLGMLEEFCKKRFIELVLGWIVVPGDESRDAQSATLQLLSSLSRQFESDELHVAFDHGVHLAWESDSVDEGRPRSDHHAEASPAVCGNQEGQLSLTRLLSKLVVACKQGTVVLDGVPPAAIASLQAVGYLPVELAFNLGAGAIEGHRALSALAGDGVVGELPGLSILLGPAYLGYVCSGYYGSGGGGTREQACLSVHGALMDVARGVATARRTGCSVQVRPRPVSESSTSALSCEHAPSASAARTTVGGTNPYFPALLSDILAFFGGGLCWGLSKASAAVNPTSLYVGAAAELEREEGMIPKANAEERSNYEAPFPLQAPPDPALLVMKHVLKIDAGALSTDSADQLLRCLEMLLESWNPFARFRDIEGDRGRPRGEEMALLSKMDDVLWGMHVPGLNGCPRFCVNADNRFLLKALQRRHIDLQQACKVVADGLQASTASLCGNVGPLFLEVLQTARLLKLSGRLLQTISFHILGPDPTSGDGNLPSPQVVPSPASGRSAQAGREEQAMSYCPHSTGSFTLSGGALGGDAGMEESLLEWVAQLPSSARFNAANRYLDEIRALARAWDPETRLRSGKAVLHASLAGLLGLLTHDMPAAQVAELCDGAIYK